jgi:ubiquinone/menaquinone biosynthesis C-methylase UbiE
MRVRRKLFHIYDSLRDAIAPGLRYSQDFYEESLRETVTPDLDWLDLGCGHRVLPEWRGAAERDIVQRCRSVTGVDYDMTSLTRHRSMKRVVRGDVASLPFRGESFDLVTANMVVEHLVDPERQFLEIGRVLRPGGVLLLHTPNALAYPTMIGRLVPDAVKRLLIRALDSRSAEDVFPTHYRANSRRALARLADGANLRLAKCDLVATDAIFALVPPLAALELMVIRLLLTRPLRQFRSNIIAMLQKPGRSESRKRQGFACCEDPPDRATRLTRAPSNIETSKVPSSTRSDESTVHVP